jgi:hypothetical protein
VLSIKHTLDGLLSREPLDVETLKIVELFKEMETKHNDLKKEIYNMKRKELERINKEFLVNEYERRYNVGQEVIVSVIVGEDHVNSEMNRQVKEQKVSYNLIV